MDALNFELARVLIAVIGTAFAAYQDFRTSFIDDKILFSMIGAGALITLASLNETIIVYTFVVAAFIFLMGYVLYRQGQLGMGDVLLFVGLQLLLPFHPQIFSDYVIRPFPFELLSTMVPLVGSSFLITLNILKHLLFFLTIFLVSSYVATLVSGITYARELFKTRKPLKPSWTGAGVSLFVLVIAGFVLWTTLAFSYGTVLFLLLLLSTAFFLTFREQLLEEVVTKRMTLKEIEDEDILALESMPKRIVQKYHLGKVLTKSEVKKLKLISRKERMTRFPVYKILPRFGPYILIGLLVALAFGDLFSLLFRLSGG
ncbi:prepilin peptidase [Candidatus Micrarchaeota archaeon]|nr:prepilin peptidase [Candidatus Micrarchaeota archaeon]